MSRPAPTHRNRALNRGVGLMLVAAATVTVIGLFIAPIPDFADLEPRTGVMIEARRERFSPCRGGDCTRTMVTVDHDGARATYHFADADTALFRVGAPITVWTYPEFRGFDRVRVWHAEQGGRVLRDHTDLAAADRRIRLALVILAPLFLGIGLWLMRTYDWKGRRVR